MPLLCVTVGAIYSSITRVASFCLEVEKSKLISIYGVVVPPTPTPLEEIGHAVYH